MIQKYFSPKSAVFLCCLFLSAILTDSCAVFSVNTAKSISEYERQILAALTGETAISDNVFLPDRYTVENKKIAAEYLAEELKKLKLKPEFHDYSARGENVFAVIHSTTNSQEYIVLGAHYDSVGECPGANDNASGVASVMGAAKYFVDQSVREKNILIVLFDEEERGLKGSKAFAKKIFDEELDISSVHTVDQLGWDGDGDKAIEVEAPYDGLMGVYKEAAKNLGMEITIHNSRVTATDHRAFRQMGYRAAGLSEEYFNKDTTPHYHKSTDTFDTVDLEYLELSTKLFIRVIKKLMSDGEPG